jgi:hypothetical protein
METIDLTPNWQTSFAILTAALENGTDKGKHAAREELQRLGRQLDAAASCSSSPYSPELAEAFRQGARELQIDRLDVAPDAIVEEGEGGAYVRCRVYVSDAERLPMPGEEIEQEAPAIAPSCICPQCDEDTYTVIAAARMWLCNPTIPRRALTRPSGRRVTWRPLSRTSGQQRRSTDQ